MTTTSLPSFLREQGKLHRLERARKRNAETERQYQKFARTYYNDPAAFVHDCFHWKEDEDGPTDYQLEILAALIEHYRVSGRGPHGLGKTTLEAWAVHWFANTREALEVDWKIPATASAWRQLTKFLFPEIHKWAHRLNWAKLGRPPYNEVYELQTLALKLNHGEAFAVASNQPSLIEGAHATELLYLFDEAKAIPAQTFDAAEGAFSNAGETTSAKAYALAMSTPGDTSGRFYDIQRKAPGYEDWFVRHVKLSEAIAARRISAVWVAQRRKQWGEKSPRFLNRVLGEFAEAGTDVLIPLAWVEAAHERWLNCDGRGKGTRRYGVDVARFGDDNTVIARLVGTVLESLEVYEQLDTMQTVGKVIVAVNRNKKVPVQVDVIGIGAGVVDRLREQGYSVSGVNVSESAKDEDNADLTDDSDELMFVNLRSYLWWRLRERLDPDGTDPIALPPDDRLTSDLTAPRWKETSSGRIKVESKDDIRKRIGRSTDYGDAAALAVTPIASNRKEVTPGIW